MLSASLNKTFLSLSVHDIPLFFFTEKETRSHDNVLGLKISLHLTESLPWLIKLALKSKYNQSEPRYPQIIIKKKRKEKQTKYTYTDMYIFKNSILSFFPVFPILKQFCLCMNTFMTVNVVIFFIQYLITIRQSYICYLGFLMLNHA